MNEKLILIVDDEKDIRNIIRYNLEKQGMRCITASDGVNALKKLEKNPEKFPEEVKRIQESNDLFRELAESDILIVATAMYNFNVPANLKLWIDHVVRSWQTFHTLCVILAPLEHCVYRDLLITDPNL